MIRFIDVLRIKFNKIQGLCLMITFLLKVSRYGLYLKCKESVEGLCLRISYKIQV
jgi:hypothetical protein